SADPRFLEARAGRTYYGPVYFRNDSEPYMTIAVPEGGAEAGVTVAEVNLKFALDEVSRIKVGQAGYAYVVDSGGQLIAHPDISLVLQKTDLSALPQVLAARASRGGPSARQPGLRSDGSPIGQELQGRQGRGADRGGGGWVFVEEPIDEAYDPLYASIRRTALLLLAGLALAVLASFVLARRMVTPIQALQAGAARIGAGALDQRIEIKTGDELEALA